jgi:hypothetical protein
MAVDFSAGDEVTIFPMRPAAPEASIHCDKINGWRDGQKVRPRNKQNITDIDRCYSPGLKREDALRTEFSSLWDNAKRK